jgi:hypothetical protein
MDNTYYAIISHQRAKNVKKMQELVPNAVWYVGKGEGKEYKEAGAINVIESGGLIESRNKALDDAHKKNMACVQLSDDFGGVLLATEKNDKPISIEKAVKMMEGIATKIGAKLAGTAPTANRFYVDVNKPVRTHHFIVGDFIWVAPTKLRFDTELRLKEDYDYTAQHLKEYGVVARVDVLMAKFAHRTNAGGAVAYRTSQLEQDAIAYLKKKWAGVVVDNPRRPDEVLFKGEVVLRSRNG